MKTIKNKNQIELFFKSDKTILIPGITIKYLINSDIEGNICFVAGKKNGNAVWRNKAKRRLRELSKKIEIKDDVKLLFLARKDINKYKFSFLENKLIWCLNKKGLMKNDK